MWLDLQNMHCIKDNDDPSTFSIFLYPFGFRRAFVTISNKATSEIEHRASPWKSRFSEQASIRASTFDVTVAEQWQYGHIRDKEYIVRNLIKIEQMIYKGILLLLLCKGKKLQPNSQGQVSIFISNNATQIPKNPIFTNKKKT